jgi:hypothetical protein
MRRRDSRQPLDDDRAGSSRRHPQEDLLGQRGVDFRSAAVLSYTPEHRETAFLLGGIGTGSVSLGARGELRDWELFNGRARASRCLHIFSACGWPGRGKHRLSVCWKRVSGRPTAAPTAGGPA